MAIKTGQGGEMMLVLRVRDDGSAVVEKFGKNTEDSAKKSSKAFDDFTSGAGVNFKSFAVYAGIAAAAAIGIGVAMVKSQIDIADATVKTADRLGTTAEAVSALTYVASLADVSAQELANSLQFMNRNLSDAAKGTGEARFAIKDLGLSAKDLKDLKPEEAMLKIAEALEKIPSQADRAAIAADIFNDRTGKMLLVLKGGPAAIRANIAEAERFGQVISTETAKAAEEFNDNLTRLKANLTGMANNIAAKVVPALVSLTNAMLGIDRVSALGDNAEGLRKLHTNLNVTLAELQRIADVQQERFGRVEPGLLTRIHAIDEEINRVNNRLAELRQKQSQKSGTGGIDSRAEEEAAKKLAQEREKLAQEILEIHRATLSEQIRAAEEYVENFQKLERGRAIGVIKSDQDLAARRLELAAQYETQLAELALQDPSFQASERAAIALAAERAVRQEALAARVEDLRLVGATEEQIEADRYARQIAALYEANQTIVQIDEEGNTAKLVSDQEFAALREQLKAEHERRVTDLEGAALTKRYGQAGAYAAAMQKLWKQGASGQIQVAESLFGDLGALMQSKHKSMFEIGKKAALVSATISTYEAVASGYATKPFWPLGLAMGTKALLLGTAQIQNIRKTEFGSGNATGTFSASPSSGLPTGGFGDTGGPALTPPPLAAAGPTRIVNIQMRGSDLYSPSNIRDQLLPPLLEAFGDGAGGAQVSVNFV